MSNQIKPQTLKGFRDFLPKEEVKRQYVVDKIRKIFELYGFDPLETPALEYAQTLLGKYGEESDKLLYLFEDRGGRKIGLRYDQTVPLARVIAQYYYDLPHPFKRYQIQPVWRAENPQKGRFREFLQCDIDTIGVGGIYADTEIITCVMAVMKTLGFKKAKMLINDRSFFKNLMPKFVTAIDKLEKIGTEGVIEELIEKGMDKDQAKRFIISIDKSKPTPLISSISKILRKNGLNENEDFEFSPSLARGLDYYTSTIFELRTSEYKSGSLGGGGRYDNLIMKFFGRKIEAVGFSFGFDRLLEAMQELQLIPQKTTSVFVLVTVFSDYYLNESLDLATKLRTAGINTDIYLNIDLSKQLKYADKKGIPYVVIIGPDEIKKNVVKLKNMKTGEQKETTQEKLIEILRNK